MKRGGFTVIELLAVISIISVLMAILLPLIMNTKQHAKAVLCQSNLKQLTATLLSYELENETFPPGFECYVSPPGGYLGTSTYDRFGSWWINYISDYSSQDQYKKTIFNCPSKKLTDIQFKDIILYGNYGINYSLCKNTHVDRNDWKEFEGKPLSSKNIANPSKTLLIADSGYSLITWRHVSDKDIDSLPRDSNFQNIRGADTSYIPGLKINSQRIDKSLRPCQEEDALKGRHPQKTVNAGFVDGHVEQKRANDLLVEKTDSGYKNRSPLWLPN